MLRRLPRRRAARLNRQLYVADHRGVVGQRKEPVVTPVVQQLPRQVGELGTVGKPEPYPQRGLLFPSTVQASAQALTHCSSEDGIEQLPAEQLRRDDWGGFDAPDLCPVVAALGTSEQHIKVQMR